jgi:hypothetical protein
MTGYVSFFSSVITTYFVEMSTGDRNEKCFKGKAWPVREADNLTAICELNG